MKQIKLTKGKSAIVADRWFKALSQWPWYAQRSGDRLWYAARRESGKVVWMHRVVAGAGPGEAVDHQDGNGLHNWPSNLRLATNSQNHGNTSKQRGIYSSIFKGVGKSKGRWRAYIVIHGKHIHLGHFSNPVSAARAYNAAARRLFGKFARVNKL